jgi:trehalose-phosphatase
MIYSAFQARELQNHLEQNVVGKLPVECLTGRMNVEMRPSLINKGSIIKRAIAQNPDIEFVFCAGDDRSDEDMFRTIEIGGIDMIKFTVIVGPIERKTLANWKVNSTREFVSIMEKLAKKQF